MGEGFKSFKKQVNSGLGKKRWSAKSITALILFGAIIAVFALSDLSNRSGKQAGIGGSVAEVNHILISDAQLQREAARMEQMYAPLFGSAGIGDAQRQFVRQQALENLISQEVSYQSAKKAGVLATDAEVQDVIGKDIPVFQKDGRFQRDLYYQILKANYINPVDFETQLRKEKVNIRTQRLFEVAASPLKVELEKLKALQETKLNVAFARVDKEKVLLGPSIADSEVQAALAKPDFAKKVEDYYNNNKAEFAVEPQVRAQHILIKTDEQTNSVAAKAKIDDLRKRAKDEDFAKLAREFSQDEGSKGKGGDLGFFSKGKMVPEFETAAFNQKVGEVGDVIRSPFGYHVIKVLERKEGSQKTLDQVRSQIAQKLIATERYDAELKTLEEALAKGDMAAVDLQVKKLGGTWEETGFFDMTADAIPKLASPEASKVAFEVSEAQPLYPKLIRDGSEKYVLRLKASKKEAPASVASLEETVARERSSDLFRAWIEGAKKTARIERHLPSAGTRTQ